MTTEEGLRNDFDRLNAAYLVLQKQRDAWCRLARARGAIIVHGPTPSNAERAQKAADVLEGLGINSSTGRRLRSKRRAAGTP